jgi:hypothetical protein
MDYNNGLLGLGQAIPAAIQGFYDAEDRKYRKMETEAKLKSQNENQQRQKMLDELEMEKNSPKRRREAMNFDLNKSGQQGIFDENDQFQRAEYRPDYMALKQRLARNSAMNLSQNGGVNLTPGQKKLDEEFAKEYSNFVPEGGFADLQKNIAAAREVAKEMGEYQVDPKTGKKTFKVNNDSISGPVAGFGWKSMRDVTNPTGSGIEDRIRGLLMQSLKAIGGANPTDKDMEEVMRAGFNPRLGEEENYNRLMSLLDSYEEKGRAKFSAAKQFEQTGSLQNYEGSGLLNRGLVGQSRGLIQPQAGAQQPQAVPMNVSDQEKNEALDWAKKNPNNPKAREILKRLGL